MHARRSRTVQSLHTVQSKVIRNRYNKRTIRPTDLFQIPRSSTQPLFSALILPICIFLKKISRGWSSFLQLYIKLPINVDSDYGMYDCESRLLTSGVIFFPFAWRGIVQISPLINSTTGIFVDLKGE